MQSIENIEGVSVSGMNTNNLRYADDTAVIANLEENFQLLMTTVKEACETKRKLWMSQKIQKDVRLNWMTLWLTKQVVSRTLGR